MTPIQQLQAALEAGTLVAFVAHPIETAPKDREIMLCCEMHGPKFAWWPGRREVRPSTGQTAWLLRSLGLFPDESIGYCNPIAWTELSDMTPGSNLAPALLACVEALEAIANPIAYLQKRADDMGCGLEGMMAVRLSQDPNWLQEQARAALKALEGEEAC